MIAVSENEDGPEYDTGLRNHPEQYGIGRDEEGTMSEETVPSRGEK